MNNWNNLTHYAGLDWSSDHHDVVVVDRQGEVKGQWTFEHTAEGWKQLGAKLRALGTVAVAVETNQGLAVEQLVALELAVYPVNPQSAKRYRERKAPTGVKSDQLDA